MENPKPKANLFKSESDDKEEQIPMVIEEEVKKQYKFIGEDIEEEPSRGIDLDVWKPSRFHSYETMAL